MLQGANTDLFNPLVPKAHKSECQNLLFPLQIKRFKVSQSELVDFYFLHPGTNWFTGLTAGLDRRVGHHKAVKRRKVCHRCARPEEHSGHTGLLQQLLPVDDGGVYV